MTPLLPTPDSVILVVENDPDDQAFIQRALKTSGLVNPVAVVSDAEDAIAYLRGFGQYEDRALHPLPSLVITDLKMPRMGGVELLAWMQARPEFQWIPTIVLTSSSDQADVNAAFGHGARGYMVKPVQFKDLEAMMQAIGTYWRTSRMPSPGAEMPK